MLINRKAWYLQQEALEACRAIRRRLPEARIITYGSSMGAYAAINHAGLLDADQIVAISPLSTIFPPFMDQIDDGRFREDREGLDPALDIIGSGALMDRRGLLFFDPLHRRDALHAARLASLTRMTLVAVPGEGHPVGPAINRCSSLGRLLTEVVDATLDIDALRRAVADPNPADTGLDRPPKWLAAFCETLDLAPREVPIWKMRDMAARAKEEAHTLLPSRGASVRLLVRFAEVVTAHDPSRDPSPLARINTLSLLCITLFTLGESALARQLATPLPAERRAWFEGKPA